jgi:undecaprenyl-diphosphatase
LVRNEGLLILSDLTLTKAVILGVVQGLTEFLPISSSAHLAFSQKLLKLDPSSHTILLFDMLTHVGTLVSMAVVFGHTLKKYLLRLVRECSPSWGRPNDRATTAVRASLGRGEPEVAAAMVATSANTLRRPRLACRFLMLGIVATIPTGVIGLAFKDMFEASFGRTRQVGVELILTGFLLVIVAWLPRGRKGWRRFTWFHAFLIGLGQAAAILPGISRSGTTISTAAYCGLRRRWAGDFSFFIAVPAILGATLLLVKDAFALPKDELAGLPWGPMLWGSIVSAAVGTFSLWLLIRMVQRSHLHWFAPYCWIVGLLAALGLFS